MPRRRKGSFTREIGVDLRFKSTLVEKFINVIMDSGKKNVARNIVYGAIDILAKKSGAGSDQQKYLKYFAEAFEKVIPLVEVRSRRVGGSVYQVPREVRTARGRALAFRWVISAAESRSGKTMAERLAYELMDAHAGRGNAIKKKLDVHRMAEASRAFAHYAW
ncbi:MAG: 30S ribosomal protein S7 [candidate division TM6 bacterium GW2011_GWF2_30_66]|jgi:small subunit ribosomal protein S7|nr:MAG: 30S ribosomal protein S7 [candidate division TM6 bacterium GW2011_GWF2_30_66]